MEVARKTRGTSGQLLGGGGRGGGGSGGREGVLNYLGLSVENRVTKGSKSSFDSSVLAGHGKRTRI